MSRAKGQGKTWNPDSSSAEQLIVCKLRAQQRKALCALTTHEAPKQLSLQMKNDSSEVC